MYKHKKNIISEKEIFKISNILKDGGVVAFPTDTVWGIGCLVKSQVAVNKIYKLKKRNRKKPLILLGNKLKSLFPYVKELPRAAKEMAETHFPGALTLVVKKSLLTPDYITSGYDTVGIRVPNHPVFLEMLERAVEDHVLATTSANISGKPAMAKKQDVLESLGKYVDYILDEYGFFAQGKESTIISVNENNEIKTLRTR